MNSQVIKSIVIEQQKALKRASGWIRREGLQQLVKYSSLPHAVIIAGVRRCGKSTLLYQTMERLSSPGYYFNFEDERLVDFSVADFNKLYEVLVEINGERDIFFFDEIQNVVGWERFVRRMIDRQKKFFITGSNASLLSKELGTKLTGRYVAYNLFPFSFREYLSLQQLSYQPHDLLDTTRRATLKKHFNYYLLQGGMPEYLRYQSVDSLKKVYDDILYRDVVARYEIKDVQALRELSLFLLSNIASSFSYNQLKTMFRFGSVNTVRSYVHYLENSFLFFTLRRYDYSVKRQLVAPKKIYCIDNGLMQNIAFSFSQNRGHFLENLVFLELRRRGQEVFYYQTKDNQEVDFVIRNGVHPCELMQVCFSLANYQTKKREIAALVAAMDELQIQKSLLLTDNDDEVVVIGKKKIIVKPVFHWLLEGATGELKNKAESRADAAQKDIGD